MFGADCSFHGAINPSIGVVGAVTVPLSMLLENRVRETTYRDEKSNQRHRLLTFHSKLFQSLVHVGM